MKARPLRPVLALALVGGCVGTNPDWDGASSSATGGGSTADERSSTSSTGIGDASTDEVGTEDESSADATSGAIDTGVDAETTGAPPECIDDPTPFGLCSPFCANGCDDGTCLLRCNGTEACDGLTVDCPVGWPCRVECSGKESCEAAQILCPAYHACEVTCTGDHACKQAHVQCAEGSCALARTGDEHVCDQAVFACGANDSTMACDVVQHETPTIDLAPASSCACDSLGC